MAKKELITELDMSSIEVAERGQTIDRLLGLTTLYLEERYPVAQGYKHKRMEFKPYEKTNPELIGVHLTTQRGLIWGYSVTFRPLAVENQTVSVTLSTTPRLLDIVLLGALGPVVAVVVWLFGTNRIKMADIFASKDSRDPVVALILLFLLWIVFIGIFWLLLLPVLSMMVDKEAQAQEMSELRAQIRDLIVAQ